MKRFLLFFMITALLCGLSACGSGKTSSDKKPESEQTHPSTDVEECVHITRNGACSYAVTLNLPIAAGKDISVVAIDDLAAQEVWQTDKTESVVAIEQITLDVEGSGYLILTTPKEAVAVIVTYDGGSICTQIVQ